MAHSTITRVLMGPGESDSNTSLLHFFQIQIYALTCIGFSMLALAGQISAPVFLLFVPLLAVAFFPGLKEGFRLSARHSNLLTWAYVPFFVLDMYVLSRSFVPATLHLILFVQLVKIHQPKQDRDYFYLLVLSLLQVLAASSLTIDLSFLILFVAYIFVSLATLITFEMKRSSQRAMQLREEEPFAGSSLSAGSLRTEIATKNVGRKKTPVNGGSFPKIETQQAIRSIAVISAVSLLTILLFGTAFFFAIPRFGAGYFHRMAHRSSSLSGFSENIRLGGIGTIQLDPAVVMRVRVADPSLLKGARWRGVTLDHFDGKNWSKHVRGVPVSYPAGRDFRVNSSSGSGTRVSYQVLLEPTSSNYLFTLNRILRLEGGLSPVTKDPYDDSITARSHPFHRLTYQAESLVAQEEISSHDPELPLAEQQAYLQLPSLEPQIWQLAMQASAGAVDITEKARKIEAYLRVNFSYSLDQAQIENPQPLAAFLLENRRGHCEYFASSMVVLLRTLRIPARIVNGFQSREYNSIGDDYIIRGRDAHSWVEVLVPQRGWLPFDPTPPVPESLSQNPLLVTFSNYLDAFELFWAEWVVGYDDVIQVSLFRDLHEKTTRWAMGAQYRLYVRVMELQKWFRSSLRGITASDYSTVGIVVGCVLIAGLMVALLMVAYRKISWPYWLRGSLQSHKSSLTIRFYEEFLNLLGRKGRSKRPHLTALEYAATFPIEGIGAQVRELTRLYNFARFSGEPMSESELQRAYHLLQEIRHCDTWDRVDPSMAGR